MSKNVSTSVNNCNGLLTIEPIISSELSLVSSSKKCSLHNNVLTVGSNSKLFEMSSWDRGVIISDSTASFHSLFTKNRYNFLQNPFAVAF